MRTNWEAGDIVKHKLAPFKMIVLEADISVSRICCRYYDYTINEFIRIDLRPEELEEVNK